MRNYKLALASLGTLVACSPITEDFTLDEGILSADQLNLTVTAQQIDGKNGNVIIVENNSPILSEWTIEDTRVQKAYAEIPVSYIGQQTVSFRGINAGKGSYTEKVFTVQVDTISTIPASIAQRLCIGQPGAPTYFGTTIDRSLIEFSNEENRLTVRNGNPVLTQWSCGGATSDMNLATLKINGTGEFPLSATFTLANGQQVTEELGTIVVKQFDLPQIVLDLVGEHGEKTWVWDDKNFYGFGGYMEDTYPSWFAYDAATMAMYAPYFGMSGEETGSMTLNLNGSFSVNPTGRTGSFTYDFDDYVPNWSVGKLKVDGSIIFGMAISMETYQPSYLPTEFYIVKCDAEHLVLAALCQEGATEQDWAACTMWCFKAGEENPMAGKSQLEKNLFGETGTKTWTWDDKNFYGFGGYMEDTYPSWFAYDAATMSMYAPYFGMSGEETGSITLSVDGGFSIAPTERTGSFTYDFDDYVSNWSIGKLKVDGSFLFGMAISMETYQPSYLPTEFYIVKCDADHLVLAALCQEGGPEQDWAACTMWCLKPVK